MTHRNRSAWRIAAAAIGIPALVITGSRCNGGGAPERRGTGDVSPKARRVEDFANLPLRFEPNVGQTDPSVRFLTRAPGYTLYLTAQEAVLVLARGMDAESCAAQVFDHPGAPPTLTLPLEGGGGELGHRPVRGSTEGSVCGSGMSVGTMSGPGPWQVRREAAVVRLRLEGASATADAVPGDVQPGKSHYFVGSDPAKWFRNVPGFNRVTFDEIYPGIGVTYYGRGGEMEYDFIVAPGADPRGIRFEVEGADDLQVDSEGDLVLSIGNGALKLRRPVGYQDGPSGRTLVPVAYSARESGRVGLAVGAYDGERPLILDPVVSFSSYLGGSGSAYEAATNIVADPSGSAVVTGVTNSLNFPVAGAPFQGSFQGQGTGFFGFIFGDAFVTKFTSDGQGLVYSTYLGGSGDEVGISVALDASGNVLAGGYTNSTNFPVSGGIQPVYGGGTRDGFLTKLLADGSALLFSSYYGGTDEDLVAGVQADPAGQVYLGGWTKSSAGFPITPGAYQVSHKGNWDGFVGKLDSSGATLVYSTYLGGAGADGLGGLAVDSLGQAHVGGYTTSSDFPTLAPIQTDQGSWDAFLTKLDSSGSALLFSSYLGGSSIDQAEGLAMDAAGRVYLVGSTSSSDFPLVNPLQGDAGGTDAFVAQIDPVTSTLVFSTYLGGSGSDGASQASVDAAGIVTIVGATSSGDFPTVSPIQAAFAGVLDAFVATIDPATPALTFSTYYGGGGFESANRMALDGTGGIYFVGYTESADFPTTPGAFQPTFQGPVSDGFVVKLVGPDLTAPNVSQSSCTPSGGSNVLCTADITDASGVDAAFIAVTITDPAGAPIAAPVLNPLVSIPNGYTVSFTFSPNLSGVWTITWASADLPGNAGSSDTFFYQSSNGNQTINIVVDQTFGPVTGLQNLNLNPNSTGTGTIYLIGLVAINGTFTINNTSLDADIVLSNVTLDGDFSLSNTDVNATISLMNTTVDSASSIEFTGGSNSVNAPITFSGTDLVGSTVKFQNADVNAPISSIDKTITSDITFSGVVMSAPVSFTAGGAIAVPIDFINTEVHAAVRMGELEGAGSVRFTNTEVNAPITILDSTLEAEVQFSNAQVDAPVTIQDSTLLKKYCISGVVSEPIALVGVVVDQMQNCGGGK